MRDVLRALAGPLICAVVVTGLLAAWAGTGGGGTLTRIRLQVTQAAVPMRAFTPQAAAAVPTATRFLTIKNLSGTPDELVAARTPLAPDLPAIAEMFPGFETRIWYGLVAPAGTPRAVVVKLHDVVAAGLAKPEVKARLAGLGLEAAPMQPDEFADFIKQEIAKWTKEVREAGIEPQ